MKPKKIMYVVGSLHLGGAEKLASSLVSGIEDRFGFSCSICSLGGGGEYSDQLINKGYKVHLLGYEKQLGIKGVITAFQLVTKLKELFVQENVDIVHTYLFYTGLIGRIAARLANVSIVVHSFFRIFYRIQPIIEWLLQFITDQYIVDSCAVKDMIIKDCKIIPDKIKVIYNGINFKELGSFSQHNIRIELGIQKDKCIIGIVAHLNKEKGHSFYLKAFAKVLEICPDTYLLIVGDGILHHKLVIETRELDIEHQVLFLGYRSDLASVLISLDLLVLPSSWEGFGIVQAEAMYFCIPVIGTNRGGATEVIEPLKTGFLIPYGDIDQLAEKTIFLLQNNDKRIQMGLAGKKRVLQLFSIERMLNDYESLYSSFTANMD